MTISVSHIIRLTYLFIVIGMYLPSLTLAQGQNAIFRNLTPEDGLPVTTVVDVAQDSYGFIWIGSWDGSYRYDGREFEQISNQGRYLEPDSKGGMWISVNRDGPIAYYHTASDSLTYYDVPNFTGNYPKTVIDAAGRVWNETPVGLYQFSEMNNSFELDMASDSTFAYMRISVHADSSISFFYRDSDEILGVGHRSKNGIFTYESLPVYDNNPEQIIDDASFWDAELTSFQDNGLLLISYEHGWWAYKKHYSEKWTFVTADRTDILADAGDIISYENNLYVITENGLARFNVYSGQSVIYKQDPQNSKSILPVQDAGIGGRLYIDRQDILWIPSFSFGISRLNLHDSDFGLLRDKNGKPIRDVISALELEDGSFWIGSRDQNYGLQHFDADGNVIRQYLGYFNLLTGKSVGRDLSHPYIWSLTVGADGSIWAGGGSPNPNSGGLNRIRPGSDQITRFKHDPDNEASLYEGNWVSELTEDGSGRIWMQDWNQLAWIDPETEVITRFNVRNQENPDESESPVFYSLKTREGDFILSYSDNIYFRINHKDLSVEEIPFDAGNSIPTTIIRQDINGQFWAGNISGFGPIDSTLSNIESWYDITDFTLPVTALTSMQFDDDNNIWLTSNNGLLKFDLLTEKFTHYTYERGLQGINFESRVSYKGPSGKIYFGDNGGINIFDPQQIQINPHPPEIVLTDLSLDGNEITLPPTQSVNTLLDSGYNLTIPPDVSAINFTFAALHFGGNESNQFEYKLEGFDSVWRSGGTIGQAMYTNLSPGNYRFKIRAANLDGVWSDGTSSISFIVLPPWYLTWWAYSIYAALLVFGLISFNKYQRNKLIQKEREQAREKELEQAREIERAYKDLEIAHEELKAAQQQLVQQEKLASLGQLTAGIAHEIKNPLNFVNNFSDLSIELIEEAREELKIQNSKFNIPTGELSELLDDIEANLKKIYEHGSRADSIVKSMLEHSRGGSGKMEPANLNTLLKEFVNLSFHGMRAGKNPINVDIHFDLDESIGDLPLIVDDFSRVIINLCNNAFDAMREKVILNSELKIQNYSPTLTIRTLKRDGKVQIEIEDNGPGIPEEIKDKIMQPFFTTKKGTEGTGLGLSITNDIIKAHGGSLNIDCKDGEGSTFSISLNVN